MCAKCYQMQNSFMARYGMYFQACEDEVCEDKKKEDKQDGGENEVKTKEKLCK